MYCRSLFYLLSVYMIITSPFPCFCWHSKRWQIYLHKCKHKLPNAVSKNTVRGDCVKTNAVSHNFTLLTLHLQTQLGQTNSQNNMSESFISFNSFSQFVIVPSCVLYRWLFLSFVPPLYSATWRIKRLQHLHPCVCPSVLENNTRPNFLVRLTSYRGWQGSPAILRPHQLAVPCWSQWNMPGRQGTGVKCSVEVC